MPRSGLIGVLAALAVLATWPAHAAATESRPPRFLSETGLFVRGSTDTIVPGILSFTPQYPLWSDGTSKRRWISLPPGSRIDASRPDAWEFPVGTRLWKEFSYGRRVETRMIERLRDGSWRFAVYVWSEDGRNAELAPSAGIRALPVDGAPRGRYIVPAEADCRACHEGAAVPVLGFSALQLSPDRDPLAPHAETPAPGDMDLPTLVARGLLRNLPRSLIDQPPRIPADSAVERAALGYLHANCGHCHSDPRETDAGVPLDLVLAQSVARPQGAASLRASLFGAPSRYQSAGAHAAERAQVLTMRMRSRDRRVQMPPLGTQVPDLIGLSLIERWIAHDFTTTQEKLP